MKEKVEVLQEIDSLLFHTKRLIIMSLLVAMGPQTKGNLRKKGGLTWGAITAHLKQLEIGNYINQKDIITRDGPRVLVSITHKGINVYYKTLEQLNDFINENS